MINKAIEFATEKHKDQKYGEKDYIFHLTEVFILVAFFNGSESEQVAAILHDCVEDQGVQKKDIEERFGSEVAEIVMLVSDKQGKNRVDRQLNTYYLIRKNDSATVVKLCDRLANMNECINSVNKKKAKMYEREYIPFKFALYEPNKNVEIWAALDVAYDKLKKIIK